MIPIADFFEKIYKIDKLVTRLIKKEKERDTVNNIRDGRGGITREPTDIKKTVREYYEQLCQ